MNNPSNWVCMTSLPVTMRNWERSVSGAGENVMSPRPRTTTAVVPASMSATNICPSGTVSFRSSAVTTRSRTANSRRGLSASR